MGTEKGPTRDAPAAAGGGVSEIIGRGRREGQRLFREWYDRLSHAEEMGLHTAYVFVMGSCAEVLRSFDLELTFPEINSLQTAVRRVSLEYLNKAEDYGYSTDVCGYVKADVGVYLSDMRHPLGRIPRPSLVVATNMCNTYIKWGEIWERLYGVPVFTLDLPGLRAFGRRYWPGSPEFEADARYVQHQLEELAELCERVTGKKFSLDRLAEVEENVNKMGAAWQQTLALNQNRPAPFNSMTDGLTYMGVLNGFRGTAEGVRYMTDLLEETQEKVRLGIGTVDPERFRLTFVGTACYPAFRRFTELFENWGAVFVHSEYNAYAGGGLDKGIRFDTSRPMESLAEQLVLTSQGSMSNIFFSHEDLADIARRWKADGIVYHAIKSCRFVSTGIADSREFLIHERGVPALLLESDVVDPRCWSEAQMRNRIDAFFEALESKRAAAGAAR